MEKIESRRGLPAMLHFASDRDDPLCAGPSDRISLALPLIHLEMRCSMPIAAFIVLLAGWPLISPFSLASAQPTDIRQSDGISGSLSPLGGQEAIYSDAHGNKGPSHLGSGLPSHSFSSPHGATSGTATPFGTPMPPNLITPAPLLPLYPKGMAIPQPQAPASSGSPSGSGSFSGRPGR